MLPFFIEIPQRRKMVSLKWPSCAYWRKFSQLFIQPVPVHDVKVNFVSPVFVQMFVRCGAMSAAMQRVLVRAGTDLKSKVKQSFRVVLTLKHILENQDQQIPKTFILEVERLLQVELQQYLKCQIPIHQPQQKKNFKENQISPKIECIAIMLFILVQPQKMPMNQQT